MAESWWKIGREDCGEVYYLRRNISCGREKVIRKGKLFTRREGGCAEAANWEIMPMKENLAN